MIRCGRSGTPWTCLQTPSSRFKGHVAQCVSSGCQPCPLSGSMTLARPTLNKHLNETTECIFL